MNKKMLFIFNPHSGKGQLKNSLFEITDIFTKGGYDVTVRPTQGRNDAFEMISSYAPEFDTIVISGGDGTLNEAVRGMLCHSEENRRPIGYIPSGTTNDFASSRGIPKDPIKAAEHIITGTPKSEDIGTLNGNPFTYVAAFGAFTDVSYDTPQEIKNFLGQAAYVVEGIKRIPALEPICLSLKYGDTVIDDSFTVGCILNSTSMAGISFDGKYDVQFDDGLFELLLIKRPITLAQAQELLWGVFKGEESNEQFHLIRISSAELEFEAPEKWTLDGEYGGAFQNVEIKVLNKAVSFIL